MKLSTKERQRRRDKEIVWVTQALWIDGTWGPFARMGCGDSRTEAMSLAKQYILENNTQWGMKAKLAKFKFSRRIRFKKYRLV